MHHHTVFTLLASLACVHAWLSTSNIRIGRAQLHSTPDPANPCWQDNYDSEDDCLSITYSAAFVAEEWIKSMPCGKDADCLPENLSHPGVMGDAGVEKVNVMEYLNIKRAVPVATKNKVEKGGMSP